MNTNFTPLSERSEFLHVSIFTPDKQEVKDQNFLIPSHPSFTRLQRGRLLTQEATYPYFKNKNLLIRQTARDLSEEDIHPWKNIIDAKILFLSKRAMEVALKKILRNINQEKLYEYLQECRKKLKENFQLFFLHVKKKQEEIKMKNVP